jgi:hypothetical protein
VTFHVKLPGKTNRRFQRSVIAGITEMNDSGELVARDVSIEEMAEVQIAAFVKTCIKKVEGWDDYSVEKLMAMEDACEDLWAEVLTLNKQKEDEADQAAKKLEPISTGQASGAVKSSSTKNLQREAS